MNKNLRFLMVLFLFASCSIQKQNKSSNSETKTDSKTTTFEEPAWKPKKHSYQSSEKRDFDIIHMKLNVSFDWQKQHLFGESELLIKPYFYPQSVLKLDARGFDLHSVSLKNMSGEEKKITHEYDSEVITINLDKEYNRNEKFVISIKYTAKPNELKVGGSSAITSDKGLYFINPLGEDEKKPRQIWTQGETQSNSAWFPITDAPNEKITQELYITIDTAFTTLSNGYLVYSKENENGTKTDYWRQEKPHAPYLVMMAIGKYAVVKDKWRNMEVNYYVEPDYEKYAKNIFGNTPEMLEFFSKTLKYDYPWDKYSQVIVRDYVSGAMENTSASIFMEAVQSDDRELIDQNWDGIIAHELFHHWFGDLVTCESWSNLPLNESFANYSEYLWDEYKYGKDEADMNGLGELQQYLYEARYKREPLIRYHYKNREDMFDSHSYAKGGRVLHMLRKYVGDDAFFEALSLYLKQNEFKTAEIHNLRLAFEEVTGEDLNWFFNQWFLNLGHPELNIVHEYSETEKTLKIKIAQVQDSIYTPTYQLPLYVDFWINGEKRREKITVKNRKEIFVFNNVNAKPSAILFDGEQQLLGVVAHLKSKEELIQQYKLSDIYGGRYNALLWFPENMDSTFLNDADIANLYIDALNDKAWGIREFAIIQLQKYKGPLMDKVIPKVSELALNDPKSIVRAEALYLLSEFAPNRFTHIFEQNINHLSYEVSAEALNGYLKSGGGNKDMYVNQYKDSKKRAYIDVISEYYSKNPKPNYNEWYTSRLTDSETNSYNIYNNYTLYLKGINNPEMTANGIKILKTICQSPETSFWKKVGVYQSLLNLKPDSNAVMQEIKENETNPRLKQFYTYFLQ